jgi:hypothetical protein
MGSVSRLRQTKGDFSVATSQCLADDLPGPPVTSTTVPLPREAFFYLVRPVTLSGPGSYDSAGPGQIEGRDLEIADSGHGCP